MVKSARLGRSQKLLWPNNGGKITNGTGEEENEHLQAARVELERAVPNKGGHRERAVELIDRAIVQVNEGMAYRR